MRYSIFRKNVTINQAKQTLSESNLKKNISLKLGYYLINNIVGHLATPVIFSKNGAIVPSASANGRTSNGTRSA